MKGINVRSGRRRSGWIATALILGVLAWMAPVAAMNRVDSGEMPELAADEGLVLIAVDSSIALEAVHVRREGRIFGSGVLARLPAGRTLRLYVARAGRYEWNKVVSFARVSYLLGDDSEYHFEVKPGRITYAGDLIFRPTGIYSARLHVSNRGLAAIDWLQAEHPALLARDPFTYVGHYPDPFPEFLRSERKADDSKAPPYAPLAAPPAPRELVLKPADLWRDERLSTIELNPDGTLLAMQVKDNDKESWTVDLIDLINGEMHRVAESEFQMAALEWSGNDALLISLGNFGLEQWVNVINVTRAADGRRAFTRFELPRGGRVLDALPDDPAHILYASYGQKAELRVHKVDISSERALRKFASRPGDRLNTGIKEDIWWFADGNGDLRIAIVNRDDEPVLVRAGGGESDEILRLRADSGFSPSALSFDGHTLYGLSDENREQRDLVAFDIASRKITATLFSKAGVDIVVPILDHRRNPIGARYYQDGRLVSAYFDTGERRLAEILDKAFPQHTISVIARSRDSSQLILGVDRSDQPPKVYHLDVAARRASLIDESMPWLADRRFARSQVVRAVGVDGLAIEAYVTLPAGAGRHPLIVYAHGGPVGVSDTLHFEPDVQFLASLGYAVLQVNFRGSDGYGKAFREAGYRKAGSLIEDDIDAALKVALATHPIDAQRMCALGFSYGGYSALFSAIRWPDRFRCAISVAGVSDRLLFFTASDSGRSKEGRKRLELIVGDPAKEHQQMVETSPLYRYRDLNIPIMLAHGQEDVRVDFEHMRRMQRMLDMRGKPPVGLVFADEGHGFSRKENIHALWSGIAGFLRQHLDAPPASVAQP